MMPSLSHRARRVVPFTAGFTLVELLTVIAIIGVLAAIVIPTVGAVREKAQRAVDANNLREILKAAQLHAADNQDRLPDPLQIPGQVLSAEELIWKWPGILARNRLLTEPSVFFARHDPAYSGTPPAFILQPGTGRQELHPDFTSGRSPSWEFVGGVTMNDHPMTPVAYTRGLQANGTWSATSGVYGDAGGFVAFVGGSVAFHSSLDPATQPPGIFVSNRPDSDSETRPADVREAIPLRSTVRIYGVPPTTGAGGMIGTPNGTPAVRGP